MSDCPPSLALSLSVAPSVVLNEPVANLCLSTSAPAFSLGVPVAPSVGLALQPVPDMRFYAVGCPPASGGSFAAAGVSLLNGLTGILNLIGTGSVYVSTNGVDIIWVSGANATGSFATTLQLASLSGFTTGVSGYLAGQIAASAAGVSMLNGQSGALTLVGTGGIGITMQGQTIYISGGAGSVTQAQLDSLSGWAASAVSLGATGATLLADITGLSGAHNLLIAQTGQAAWVSANGAAATLSGLLTQSGVTLGAKVDALSGYDLATFYPLGTNPSGYLTTLSGSVTTGQLAQVSGVIQSGIAATGQAAWTSANGAASTLSGALTQSGIALLAHDLFISGLLATGIATTGSTLDSKINALSGFVGAESGALQSSINATGLSGVLMTSGLSGYLISLINAASAGVASLNMQSGVLTLQGAGNVTVTSGGVGLITISGNTGDLALEIARTASLSGFVTGTSGFLQTEINALPTSAQLASTGQQAFNLFTGLSGALMQTGITLGAKVDSLSGYDNATFATIVTTNAISGNLIQTGVQLGATIASSGATLFADMTGLSGQAVSTYATIVNLTQSGVTLEAQLNSLSGFTTGASGALQAQIAGFATTTQLTQTGVNILAALAATGLQDFQHYTGLSGALGQTGAAIEAQINSVSGWTSANFYPLVVNPAGYLTSLSGVSTGFVAQVSGVLQSGIAATGALVYADVVGLSGQAAATYATITNLALTGSNLYVTITGMSGQSVINYATVINLGITGSALYGDILGLSGLLIASGALLSAVKVTGSAIQQLTNFTGIGGAQVFLSGGYVVVSGASPGGGSVTSVNGLGGAVIIVGTGGLTVTVQGQNVLVSGDTSISGALTTTGVTLGAQIVSASGWTNQTFAHRSGDETISGNKTFSGNHYISGNVGIGTNTPNPIGVLTANGNILQDRSGDAIYYFIDRTNNSGNYNGWSFQRNGGDGVATETWFIGQTPNGAFPTNNCLVVNVAGGNNLMTLTQSRNLGIRTTNPNSALHVNGDVTLSGIATSTTANVGSATLPALPVGFVTINITGGNFKIPYYNV